MCNNERCACYSRRVTAAVKKIKEMSPINFGKIALAAKKDTEVSPVIGRVFAQFNHKKSQKYQNLAISHLESRKLDSADLSFYEKIVEAKIIKKGEVIFD